MAYPDIATKEDLANELFDDAAAAGALEELIRSVDAVLTAVCDTDLLDKAPGDEESYNKHSAACVLLADLQRKLRAHEDRPGTDLSISLHVLANEVFKGRFAHRRVLEEDVPAPGAR